MERSRLIIYHGKIMEQLINGKSPCWPDFVLFPFGATAHNRSAPDSRCASPINLQDQVKMY